MCNIYLIIHKILWLFFMIIPVPKSIKNNSATCIDSNRKYPEIFSAVATPQDYENKFKRGIW